MNGAFSRVRGSAFVCWTCSLSFSRRNDRVIITHDPPSARCAVPHRNAMLRGVMEAVSVSKTGLMEKKRSAECRKSTRVKQLRGIRGIVNSIRENENHHPFYSVFPRPQAWIINLHNPQVAEWRPCSTSRSLTRKRRGRSPWTPHIFLF